MKWLKLIAFALFLIFLDIISKYYTVLYIRPMSWVLPFYPYGGIGIFHDFFGISLSLNYVQNKGAAWGFFSRYGNFLVYLRIVIFFIILIYLVRSRVSFRRSIPYVLILSGAFCNVLDYFLYGHVVDMIHFKFGSYSYPIFNLADSMITIGVVWILLSLFFDRRRA